MTETDALEVLGRLEDAGVRVWVDGGWGVDALVGEQTREHKDLDLVVLDTHVDRMRETLGEHAFAFREGAQANFVLTDGRGRVVDIHPVRFDEDGNGHFEDAEGEPFRHGPEAFRGEGTIGGRGVRCLSADAQMQNHSWGYTPKDTDFHDMRLLHERLGTPLLGPFAVS
jgi:lincosamide nucleotidyltransferase A/C/D/E